MTEADQQTIDRMNPRRVEWCLWGITFCRGQRVIATLLYPAGSGWPWDGVMGLPEHRRYREACRAWIATGVLPEGARTA